MLQCTRCGKKITSGAQCYVLTLCAVTQNGKYQKEEDFAVHCFQCAPYVPQASEDVENLWREQQEMDEEFEREYNAYLDEFNAQN